MRVGVALALLVTMTSAAFASEGFEIVIPGRPGVPVIINGIDASYAVIESDWGLGKNVQVQPTIYGGRYIDPVPHVGHYYPSRLPHPAESYHESWSAQSTPQLEIPANPPPVIVAPQIGGDWHHQHHRRPHKLPH